MYAERFSLFEKENKKKHLLIYLFQTVNCIRAAFFPHEQMSAKECVHYINMWSVKNEMLANCCAAVAKCTKYCFDTRPNEIEENDNNLVVSAFFHTRWKETWNNLRLSDVLCVLFFSLYSVTSFDVCSYRKCGICFIFSYFMTDFCMLCSFQTKLYAFFCWRFLLITIDMVIQTYEKSHDRFLCLLDLFSNPFTWFEYVLSIVICDDALNVQ